MTTASHNGTSLFERARQLEKFGYGRVAADFLATAALAGGYFLRRQVAQFLDRKDGGAVTDLVQRALDLDHVRCSTWSKGVHLYHLASRPFYAALGDPDNRNRRRHELAQIKQRLMCLDFLLPRKSATVLATECDRVQYFERVGINVDRLPHRSFVSRCGNRKTVRFFVDRQPILVHTSTAKAHLTFGFIDEGLITLSRFERFLTEHGPLFAALDAFDVVYVSDSPRHFSKAATLAESILQLQHATQLRLPTDAGASELLTYFQLRKRFEEREFAAFSRSQLLQLRDAKDKFNAANFEAQYRAWCRTAQAELNGKTSAEGDAQSSPRSGFSTELLTHDYAIFESVLPD